MNPHRIIPTLGATLVACAAQSATAQVVGGGSTLPQSLYNEVLTASPLPGFNTYFGVGSGEGKRAFFDNDPVKLSLLPGTTIDYAGSDSLVTAAEVSRYDEVSFGPLIQIPTVLTSVTVPHNTGIANLNLSSEQLALIFSGDVVNWNGSRLGLGLPAARKMAIHQTFWNQADSLDLAVGDSAECTPGRGRPQ